MCVIIHKPENVPLPKRRDLNRCFETNPHGFGFAIRTRHGIYLEAGLMEKREIKRITAQDPSYEILIHFRRATVGGIEPDLTQPVRVRPAGVLGGRTGVLAHNGHIQDLCNPWGGSDTTELCKELNKYSIGEIRTILGFLHQITGSKFVFMGPLKTEFYGRFYLKDGCQYSNLYWELEDEPFYETGPKNGLERYYKGFMINWR